MEAEIEKALEIVRPMLALHRGGVELVSYNEVTKTANLRLSGMCVGCPLSELTLKGGIEEILRAKVPGVERVEAVS
ncbi:MAG: NifU family protein [Candidatus Sungbacteria bacterium]|uniref:NifU family protein n=1 Tax=Candidatus Sungiibacteriota bacterium TaxID=2750080 RepID=A0A931SDM1_9BACT|nr:NifU family protein [Candidatus Sungbacteria bacterium]